MGIGGHFWDVLKPYARFEGPDFLRDKKVAVDLSFWVVQHETAIRTRNARSPHIRITFFRTINLFAKLGAFPVFVLDGIPSPLKSQARMERFFRAIGVDLPVLPRREEVAPVERNRAFAKCIRECVELLELLGMPILQARCEAEALCAQLNSEGAVDACITADSDAFLYGAKCVVKCLRPNSKEPVECYLMSDIEAGLGLKRKHLIAISLLAGNDHDLQGVPGIGVDTSVRFVQMYSEDMILNRLHEIGKGDTPLLQGGVNAVVDCNIIMVDENLAKTRSPHCSYCGHPGSKRTHLKAACVYCNVYGHVKCTQKPIGFKCECSDCDKDRRSKEQKKYENWQIKVCNKIAGEHNFPNSEIIEMYLSKNHGSFNEENGPSLMWGNPKIGTLVEFLGYHQRWEPSYVRQRTLPMLSTIFLREMVSNPSSSSLLCDQYKFHSIQRVKIRYGHQYYLVKWIRGTPNTSEALYAITSPQADPQQNNDRVDDSNRVEESIDALDDLLDEADVPQILVDAGSLFLLTDENKELVQAAFPEKVEQFLQEKALKESKSKRKNPKSESPKSTAIQLNITEFYQSSKVVVRAKHGEDRAKISENCKSSQKKSKKTSSPSTSGTARPVRRRLLFE